MTRKELQEEAERVAALTRPLVVSIEADEEKHDLENRVAAFKVEMFEPLISLTFDVPPPDKTRD